VRGWHTPRADGYTPAVSTGPRGLLPTKLHPRQTRPQTVPRPRLRAQLERCAALPLTVVVGPAGAGKSTAAVAWLEQTELPVAWLSLDAGDDSPGRFVAYLLAALHTVVPEIGDDAAALLAAPEPEDLEAVLADEIVIPLAARAQPVVVVLDDVHLLRDERIHAALAWLLDHAPACLRLVLLGRSEPDLPLARLRASGALGEIGVEQLRFRLDEARRFYTEIMGLELSDEELAALERKTEGWPAGAQLAALSLRGAGRSPGGSGVPQGHDRLIADYLLDEVFEGLDAPTQEFLLATALLERLCAPLAAALTGADEARSLLAEVERASLFAIPLDAHRRWYRYHHLFRDFLRERAATRGPAWLAERHRRAASWLAARDLRHEAFAHAVASGDEALIIELFERWAAETLMRNQTGEVRRALAMIPDPLREREAACWLLDGWCDIIVGRLRTGLSKLERAAKAQAAGHGSKQVALLSFFFAPVLRVAALLRQGRYDEALASSAAARERLDPEADPTFAQADGGLLMHEGLVHLERGELEQAGPKLERAVSLIRTNEGLAVVALAHLACLRRRQGKLDEAEAHAERALRFAERSGTEQLAAGGLARVERAWVALERGDSRLALSEVEAGLERLRLLRDVAYLAHGTELLARAKAAAGLAEDALEVVDEALELLETTDMQPAIERMQALRGELGRGPRLGASAPATVELVADPPVEPLTPRETEVLGLVATGLSNREIAKRLYVSVGTVKTHMHRILAKLDAPNRTRAVHRARVAGLLG
jgi:LuxR family maltose regulon positive regulatory protein